MRAPTVVYRTDEILKGIRHCRSSMPVSFHSSTEPGVIGRSFKIFILSQSSFFFSSFLVVASLTRYRHWLSESPLYLHVNETMPYLPYPSEPGLLDFLTRFCFFFFFYLRYQPIDRRDWSRYYSREISFLWWIKLTLCLSVTKFLTWFSMEICLLTRKKNLNRTMIISKIILLRNITNFHSQKFD